MNLASSIISDSRLQTTKGARVLGAIVVVLCGSLLFESAIRGVLLSADSSVLDELAVLLLLGLALFLQVQKRTLKVNMLLLACIACYLIAVSLLFGRNRSPEQVVSQVFLHLQFFILFVALSYLRERLPGLMRPLLVVAACISIFGAAVQFVAPGVFDSVFGSRDYLAEVGSEIGPRLEGLQKNPNALGVFFAVFLVVLMFSRDLVRSKWPRIALIVCSLAIVAASGSRSAMFILGIGATFSSLKMWKKLAIAILVVIIFVSSGLLEKTDVTIQQMSSSIYNTKYIRWLMTYHGAQIALDDFPIGEGAATFGSALSRGSPVYFEHHLSSLASVYEGRGIHDSNFGTISGEFGFIGLVLFYGFAVYLVLTTARKHVGTRLKSEPSLRRFACAFVVMIVLSTFARPLFSSSYYGILFVIAFFAYLEGYPSTRIESQTGRARTS